MGEKKNKLQIWSLHLKLSESNLSKKKKKSMPINRG